MAGVVYRVLQMNSELDQAFLNALLGSADRELQALFLEEISGAGFSELLVIWDGLLVQIQHQLRC
jgi:hypothetical protein